MIEMDLQELSWGDIPVATEYLESVIKNEEVVNEVTFSVSSLAQEIQVDIASSFQQWTSAQQYITQNLAVACLCHSGGTIQSNLTFTNDYISPDISFNLAQVFESHEGHSCDECGGSIENGKCSKCGHAHHH